MDKRLTTRLTKKYNATDIITLDASAIDANQETIDREVSASSLFRTVVLALFDFEEKAEPRKLLISKRGAVLGECPACGGYVSNTEDTQFCSKCGQSLNGTTFKKSFTFDITEDCIYTTDAETGERVEWNINEMVADNSYPSNDRKTVIADIIEGLLNDFWITKGEYNSAKSEGCGDGRKNVE